MYRRLRFNFFRCPRKYDDGFKSITHRNVLGNRGTPCGGPSSAVQTPRLKFGTGYPTGSEAFVPEPEPGNQGSGGHRHPGTHPGCCTLFTPLSAFERRRGKAEGWSARHHFVSLNESCLRKKAEGTWGILCGIEWSGGERGVETKAIKHRSKFPSTLSSLVKSSGNPSNIIACINEIMRQKPTPRNTKCRKGVSLLIGFVFSFRRTFTESRKRCGGFYYVAWHHVS